ncbi:DNA-directed RNA polymerase I largest subunit, putative [Perkinsus marinus ATCC 50983]|uniref:DNA-directed RNA polymerase n=1 Tax=Perkinsus marinus (strain ATCC 50983 / TXsc) TaxID=423536 RepID=C5KQT6_PERM5|nr:DNA-directed RNA polymerase I largest subunit, putative [Perkinsus marinus ATCC 50983]EER13182.1 DNA-directed RNA polymerase I largest subunit, putative [Perkinsus marinus ATCC 50983]|eukprot:XP_002781387.1 DNA-directed RNA polymerase I largest subunit, putative [Perkinsus marinus ATCC 50983]
MHRYCDRFKLILAGLEPESHDVVMEPCDEKTKSALERDMTSDPNADSREAFVEHASSYQDGSSSYVPYIMGHGEEQNRVKALVKQLGLAHNEVNDNLEKLVGKNTSWGISSSGEIQAWNDLVAEFENEVSVAVCPNCKAKSELFRVDGYNKIFRKLRGKAAEKFVTPTYVRNLLHKLWCEEREILEFLFPASVGRGEDIFFMQNIVVPPNKLRPLRFGGDSDDNQGFLPASTVCLKNILESNLLLKQLLETDQEAVENPNDREKAGDALPNLISDEDETMKPVDNTPQRGPMTTLGTALIDLQNNVNNYLDSAKSGKAQNKVVAFGVRQLLERKQGLFRMKMMGKRVNYAARSVISPDVSLETNQIGLPMFAALQLTVPEPVNSFNVDYLRALVENGPDKYPGAAAVVFPDGKLVSLKGRQPHQRKAIARSLYQSTNPDKKPRVVLRHVRDGDPLLVNRQPTLHKPGIMALFVKVLSKEKTIRMHYSNCNTFNADFDGDEINLHCPQDSNARAEAIYIASADHQYLGPTSGKPLRGLIQDHVVSGVFLTARDHFMRKTEVQNLIYTAMRAAIEGDTIVMEPPVIVKPQTLWTGKQVITIFLKSLIKFATHSTDKAVVNGFNHHAKAKTPGDLWGGVSDGNKEEQMVTIRDTELIEGVLDKASFGATANGLTHLFYELCGPKAAGLLLTGMGRMLTLYLQYHGFTCAMRDLLITPEGDEARLQMLRKAREDSWNKIRDWVKENSPEEANVKTLHKLQKEIGKLYAADPKVQHPMFEELEETMLSTNRDYWGKLIDILFPKGQVSPFPDNCFSAMVSTGAKGSKVNHSMIDAMLGQQELEGHRAPRMRNQRFLPSFAQYDIGPRAGGYITDRFLTGYRPQEFFYHCMAGREGLVDTAVKTARSGYLQRCLVKNLEGITINYDYTVRDTDSSIVEFLYGEDGMDVTKVSHLEQFDVLDENSAFMAKSAAVAKEEAKMESNLPALYRKWAEKPQSGRRTKDLVKGVNASDKLRDEEKEHIAFVVKDTHTNGGKAPPMNSMLPPWRFTGAMSEREENALTEYLSHRPEELEKKMPTEEFRDVIMHKYARTLADPGEAVGTLAAQGMGEPSTQMTLNTFHLAGHGGVNVTLGIPRLREIVQTASRHLETPAMEFPVLGGLKVAEELKVMTDGVTSISASIHHSVQGKMTRVSLKDVVVATHVLESVTAAQPSGETMRTYELVVELVDPVMIQKAYPSLSQTAIAHFLDHDFRDKLNSNLKKFIKISESTSTITSRKAQQEEGAADVFNEIPEDENNAEQKDQGDESQNVTRTLAQRARATDEEREAELDRMEAASEDDVGEEWYDVLQVVLSQDEAEEDNETPAAEEGTQGPALGGQTTAEEYQVSKTKNSTEVIFNKSGRLYGPKFVLRSRPLELSQGISRKILILEAVADLCSDLYIQQTPGITSVHVVEPRPGQSDKVTIETEGVNLDIAWGLDGIDHDRIVTNDIGLILDRYGVEAARAAIVQEVLRVFGHYGIGVDPRHLMLISDYMTHHGGFRPFSRRGMEAHASPWLQMTFETSVNFLTKACNNAQYDTLKSPAGSIIVGKQACVGTGCFDLRMEMPKSVRGLAKDELATQVKKPKKEFGSHLNNNNNNNLQLGCPHHPSWVCRKGLVERYYGALIWTVVG